MTEQNEWAVDSHSAYPSADRGGSVMGEIDKMAVAALDQWLEQKFTALYFDLSDAFPHPFEWVGLLHERPWWQFRAKKAQRKVALLFARHGILLTDDKADHYMNACRNHPQRYDEDCGAAKVRQLRATFGYAFIGPFIGMFEVEGLVSPETNIFDRTPRQEKAE